MFTSHVIGNLGADAEVVSANGQSFVSLSIADTRKYKKADGTEVSETTWIDAIINNVNHPVIPFLKQGVKVCVYGNVSLRVYSSKKDRMMKAGATIHVLSIELCGGSSDDVPRQLIDPATGQLFDVTKHYWVNRDNKLMKSDEIYNLKDMRGRVYDMNKAGFVVPTQVADNADSGNANSDENQAQG